MHEKNIILTVLMPAYNAEKYIAEAIRSVLEQTFRGFELIIVNDGSTDNTRNIILGFSDSRIRLIGQENRGVAAALNTGLAAAQGKYIARFDADDICMPMRLQEQLNFLLAYPDYYIVGCDAEYITENGEHLFDFHCADYTHERIIRHVHTQCPFIHSGVMYLKDMVVRAGGYPTHAHSFEDHLLWVSLLKTGKCCNLPEALIKVRFNANSFTIDEKWRSKRFRQLKQAAIQRGSITEKEGEELLSIIKRQETQKIKQGSYHALCCKKFLADNFQPAKAREHAGKAIMLNPMRLDIYALLLTSYFPGKWVKWIARQRRAQH